MPAGILTLSNGEKFFAHPASNTNDLAVSVTQADPLLLRSFPKNNLDGCKPTVKLPKSSDPYALLVARGSCNFQDKVNNAKKAGASSVIVYNTLESFYAKSADKTETDPGVLLCRDYDCSLAQMFVEKESVNKQTAYKWPGYDCSHNTNCNSGACGLTGKVASHGHEVCCILDGFVNMKINGTNLPSVYVGAESGRKLTRLVEDSKTPIDAQITERLTPAIDPSSFIIWMVGVITCFIGCYISAEVDRQQQKKLHATDEPFAFVADALPDSLEVSTTIAVGFFFVASTALIVLFYAFMYMPDLTLKLVVTGYCVGAVGALTNVLILPLCSRLFPFCEQCIFNVPLLGGTTTLTNVTATLIAMAVSLWFFLERQSDYSWVLQDIMSFAFCVMILQVAQLPNIKVSTVLLSMAFCYDIFFVFISPLLFQKSVMIQVATGGQAGVPVTDTNIGDDHCIDFCDFHRESHRCPDHEALPMLFRIPRVLDWRGGSAMLGLGDIVLPGLLLTYLLRFDYRHPGSKDGCRIGYFQIGCIGYAAGLMLANAAVYLMQMGQPALLYLVPCTLGVISAVSWSRGQFDEMWEGGLEDEAGDVEGVLAKSKYSSFQGSAAERESLRSKAPVTPIKDEGGSNTIEDL